MDLATLNMVPRWEHIDTSPVSRLYNQNDRGVSIYINDLSILDWFNDTQSRSEWQWFDYPRTLTMTSRVYILFLLAHSQY